MSPGDAEVDFVGSSWTVQFTQRGFIDELQTATFTVRENAGLPLPDRQYTVKLRVTSGDARISQLGIATVTLVAVNDPFGVFAFTPVRIHSVTSVFDLTFAESFRRAETSD